MRMMYPKSTNTSGSAGRKRWPQTASCDDPGGTVDASGSQPRVMGVKIRISTTPHTNSGTLLIERPTTEMIRSVGLP